MKWVFKKSCVIINASTCLSAYHYTVTSRHIDCVMCVAAHLTRDICDMEVAHCLPDFCN